MRTTFDVIIIGGGSIGTPLALYLARSGLDVLVLERCASIGQGSNKTAIGGIRATHSDPAKIRLCQHSINVFSHWEEEFGDNIEWEQGGYVFLAYTPEDEQKLRDLVIWQKKHGLEIDYLPMQDLSEIIPSLNPVLCRGGTYSPRDGHASPLLAIHSMYCQAKRNGAEFHFDEDCERLITKKNTVIGVKTNQEKYYAKFTINAAGAWAADFYDVLHNKIKINPDAHEAGITEPVQKFMRPLIVDMRRKEKSENFYFYQSISGQVMFCLTPSPPRVGFNTDETSPFLPLAAQRMLEIMPLLANIRVRRTWCGLYPMTPDGLPFIGKIPNFEGYILAVGMCGQGFMLGPGVADILCRLILEQTTKEDEVILKSLSVSRKINQQEMLK